VETEHIELVVAALTTRLGLGQEFGDQVGELPGVLEKESVSGVGVDP
jgi:hypothetical protein